MVFWFAGTAFLAVWLIFRDPAFDYRLVMVGALLPDVVDAAFGGPAVLHSVFGQRSAGQRPPERLRRGEGPVEHQVQERADGQAEEQPPDRLAPRGDHHDEDEHACS